MISGKAMYEVIAALVPIYFTMGLAYGCVRWWKIFTKEQCIGINRFVALIALPLFCFTFVARNDPYTMNYRFIGADSLQKIVILAALLLRLMISSVKRLDSSLTFFTIATLPNTLVFGIPLLKAMYGDFTDSLLMQIVVLQALIWYPFILVIFEYRSAKLLIASKFPNTASNIASVRIDSDVESLDGGIDADAEIGEDRRIHVMVRRSEADSTSSSFNRTESRATYPPNQAVAPIPDTKNPDMDATPDARCPIDLYGVDSTKDRLTSNEIAEKTSGRTTKEEYNRTNGDGGQRKPQEARGIVMTKLIFTMVWRKLIRNPNTYTSIAGLIWSLISFRWDLKLPKIVSKSILLISDTGLAMAMFSLGLFIALQPKLISCGKTVAGASMAARFLVGPAVAAATSLAVGLRGPILRISIIQAALPQAIIPFVYAQEYNVHADILGTVVTFGMVVSLPVTIIYYILLGL